MTGWNLPPGCTSRMIDEAAGAFDECQCCGQHPSECDCPECPCCNSVGDPDCYTGPHGLSFSREQLIAQARRRLADLRRQVMEAEMELAQLTESEWR